MNGVSWLLYGAEVLNNIQGVLVATLIVCGLAVIIWQIVSAASADIYGHKNQAVRELRWILPTMFVIALVAAIIPSKTTMLAIATSEFAEDFSKTETGTEIGGLVQDTIKLLRKSVDDLNGDE